MTTEIPRNDWSAFCDSFSRSHDGWAAYTEFRCSGAGGVVQAYALPFHGLLVDGTNGAASLSLRFGDSTALYLEHTIRNPVRLTLDDGDSLDRRFDTLAVEDAEGATTLLRFNAKVHAKRLEKPM